jgi:hypothetical protein
MWGLVKNAQTTRLRVRRFVSSEADALLTLGSPEMLRTFSHNPTCKHIIFGGCHDAGYLLDLEQFRHNPEKAACITLLESTLPQRGFTDLINFRRARFDDVFRNEPLPELMPVKTQMTNGTPSPVLSSPPPLAKVNTAPVNAPVTAAPKPTPTKPPGPKAAAPKVAPPPKTAPSDHTSEEADGPTWATVGKNGASNGTYTVGSKKAKKKYIYYNKDGQRLDEPLPPRDRAAAESIDNRMTKVRKGLFGLRDFH